MNMTKSFGILFSSIALASCVTTGPVDYSSTAPVIGSTVAGSIIGALGAASFSSKGSGQRSDAAVRGALGGAAAGLGYGLLLRNSQQASRQPVYQPPRGVTQCESIYVNGRIEERCTSTVVRDGYQNF